jgi:pimeloyl-ACP methyl ester carboxylesterase
VLLVHGLAAASGVFDAIIRAGANRFRFHAVDLPRSGKSGAYAALHPSAIADAVAAALKVREVGPALVVGHSYGGLVALELAARHPGLTRGLLVASAPAYGLPRPLKLALGGPAVGLARWAKAPPDAWVRRYLSLIWGEGAPMTEAQLSVYLETTRAAGSVAAMIAATQSLCGYVAPVKTLASHGIPTALLWGERDRLVRIHHGVRLSRALGAPMTVLPGAGHCLLEERPTDVGAALEALSTLSATGQLTPLPPSASNLRERRA